MAQDARLGCYFVTTHCESQAVKKRLKLPGMRGKGLNPVYILEHSIPIELQHLVWWSQPELLDREGLPELK